MKRMVREHALQAARVNLCVKTRFGGVSSIEPAGAPNHLRSPCWQHGDYFNG
mgnify:CR=1 FL=1